MTDEKEKSKYKGTRPSRKFLGLWKVKSDKDIELVFEEIIKAVEEAHSHANDKGMPNQGLKNGKKNASNH
jgi:hypothetical protein